jgi:hypothetical protein
MTQKQYLKIMAAILQTYERYHAIHIRRQQVLGWDSQNLLKLQKPKDSENIL